MTVTQHRVSSNWAESIGGLRSEEQVCAFPSGPWTRRGSHFPLLLLSDSLMARHMSLGSSAAAFISPPKVYRGLGLGFYIFFFLLRARGSGLLIVWFVELNTYSVLTVSISFLIGI